MSDLVSEGPRLGRVVIHHEYVVDLDSENMVDGAKTALVKDTGAAVAHNELHSWVKVSKDSEGLSFGDIPDFLKECPSCSGPLDYVNGEWKCPENCEDKK